MAQAPQLPPPLQRVPSGIKGLDQILDGGFHRGGIYLITGQPGAGKTILSNQICFHHVAGGGRAVYITLLAETHARMLMHIRDLTFFDPSAVGDALYYISGYRMAEQEALDKLLGLVRRVVRERRASLLVLDGLGTVEGIAGVNLSLKEFIHKLHIVAEAMNCTTLLLRSTDVPSSALERTMVDGMMHFQDRMVGLRNLREVEVHKFRGSGYMRGRHSYEITNDGMVLYPRAEALYATPQINPDEPRTPASLGVTRLDEMLGGGVLSGSSTMLYGAPGSGKTLLGLHFLAAGARRGETGLYFGFYETPPRLISKAERIGLAFQEHVAADRIRIIWQPALENMLDRLAEQLLGVVEQHQIQRLFLDGLNGLEQAADYPERLGRFLTALTGELRARGVTTLFSVELRDLVGPAIHMPLIQVSAASENIIFLRYVELHSQLYRLVSIIKVREGDYDPAIREFRITNRGIDVASTFASAEAILTGIARPQPVDSHAAPIPAREPPV